MYSEKAGVNRTCIMRFIYDYSRSRKETSVVGQTVEGNLPNIIDVFHHYINIRFDPGLFDAAIF